jgi:hypothetical protein
MARASRVFSGHQGLPIKSPDRWHRFLATLLPRIILVFRDAINILAPVDGGTSASYAAGCRQMSEGNPARDDRNEPNEKRPEGYAPRGPRPALEEDAARALSTITSGGRRPEPPNQENARWHRS